MIYIDPPYNTGNDFVYKDKLKDSIDNYKNITGQIDGNGYNISTNTESNGRFHTDWLNMIYPRLRLARNLLTEDGVIFISIDDHEQANLKKICDEIFGEINFIGIYIKQSKVGGGSDSKFLVKEHEYCIVYTRDIDSAHEMFMPHDEEYLRRYKEIDETGRFFWDTYARPGLQLKAKDSLNYSITCPDGTTIQTRWRRSKERFQKDLRDGIVRITKKNDDTWSVQFKQYLNDSGKKPRSMTMDFGGNQEGKIDLANLFGTDKYFNYPKSVKFIKSLLSTVADEDLIVMDFFSGSATTAYAVMQLNAEDGGNRKFIMVQIPELTPEDSEAAKAGYKNICEIGKERIRRAGEKIKSESSDEAPDLDIGFRVFKLDSSNLKKWNSQTKDVMQSLIDSLDNFLPGRTELDVVYEILLKMGIELSTEIEEREVIGEKIYIIDDGSLMICLGENITLAIADEITKLHKEYNSELWQVVFRDTGFVSDMDKTNIKETLKTAGLKEDNFVCI